MAFAASRSRALCVINLGGALRAATSPPKSDFAPALLQLSWRVLQEDWRVALVIDLCREPTSLHMNNAVDFTGKAALVTGAVTHGMSESAMSAIDDVWTKVVDKQARYRFVIDMGDR